MAGPRRSTGTSASQSRATCCSRPSARAARWLLLATAPDPDDRLERAAADRPRGTRGAPRLAAPALAGRPRGRARGAASTLRAWTGPAASGSATASPSARREQAAAERLRRAAATARAAAGACRRRPPICRWCCRLGEPGPRNSRPQIAAIPADSARATEVVALGPGGEIAGPGSGRRSAAGAANGSAVLELPPDLRNRIARVELAPGAGHRRRRSCSTSAGGGAASAWSAPPRSAGDSRCWPSSTSSTARCGRSPRCARGRSPTCSGSRCRCW